MPRYIKQRDKFRCGPVVILNALKWAGVDVSYDESIDHLSNLCRCRRPRGTNHKNFDRAIREAGKGIFRTQLVRHPTIGKIEEHLQDGGALAFNYHWRREEENESSRHFSLVEGISPSGRTFYIANRSHAGRTLQSIHRERFKKWDLRFQRTDPHYKAWFLTREGT